MKPWKEVVASDGTEITSCLFPSPPASTCCVVMSKLLSLSELHFLSISRNNMSLGPPQSCRISEGPAQGRIQSSCCKCWLLALPLHTPGRLQQQRRLWGDLKGLFSAQEAWHPEPKASHPLWSITDHVVEAPSWYRRERQVPESVWQALCKLGLFAKQQEDLSQRGAQGG